MPNEITRHILRCILSGHLFDFSEDLKRDDLAFRNSCIREPYPHHIAVVAFLQPTPVQEEETNDEVQHATNAENEEAPTPVRNS